MLGKQHARDGSSTKPHVQLFVARSAGRKDHPLRVVRTMVDEVLRALSPQFDRMYASEGRPSIAPEKLLRAQLLQMLYSIRSERLLMESDYSVLYRCSYDWTRRCETRHVHQEPDRC